MQFLNVAKAFITVIYRIYLTNYIIRGHNNRCLMVLTAPYIDENKVLKLMSM